MGRRRSDLLRLAKRFSNRSKNMEINHRFPKETYEHYIEQALAIRRRHREGIESKVIIVQEINSLNENINMYLRGQTEFHDFIEILEGVREWLYDKRVFIEKKYLNAKNSNIL